MNYGNERKIDLLDLAFYVIERWRYLLLAACIGLIVFGAYKFYDTEKERAKNEALIADGREEEVINPSDYQAAIDALNAKNREIHEFEAEITEKQVDITKFNNDITAYNADITAYNQNLALYEKEKLEAERKLEEISAYIDQSVLQKLDANAKPVASKTYQVIYDGEGTEGFYRDPVDEIIAAYAQKVVLTDASGLPEKYGIPAKNYSEVIDIAYDDISNTVTAQANGVDEQMAKDILAAVCAVLEGRKKGIEERYHAHTLKPVSEEYTEEADVELAKDQNELKSDMNSYSADAVSNDSKILKTKVEIENSKASIQTMQQQIKDAEVEIARINEDIQKTKKQIIENELEEKVQSKKPSMRNSLKAGIKFGIEGAGILLILLAVLFGVIYVLDGKVHSISDLYFMREIPVLAVLNRPRRKKGCFIDSWAYRMRNKGCAAENEEIVKSGAIYLNSLREGEQRIAVLSLLETGTVSKMADTLKTLVSGVEFIPVADSLRSSDNVDKLQKTEGIVLFEKREESKADAIRTELAQAGLLEKKVIGIILE